MIRRFLAVAIIISAIVFIPYYFVDLMLLIDDKTLSFMIDLTGENIFFRWITGVWYLGMLAAVIALIGFVAFIIKYILFGDK